MSTTNCKECIWNFEHLDAVDNYVQECLHPDKDNEQKENCPYYDEGKD